MTRAECRYVGVLLFALGMGLGAATGYALGSPCPKSDYERTGAPELAPVTLCAPLPGSDETLRCWDPRLEDIGG